jgi:hypothetical protein
MAGPNVLLCCPSRPRHTYTCDDDRIDKGVTTIRQLGEIYRNPSRLICGFPDLETVITMQHCKLFSRHTVALIFA